ncbi:MAG: hypothetical protein IKW00_01335 [Clostridia bacterium]|nr:hypothetical protein [Clostridia bacterium]
MKYMTFNSSCAYAGIANMLAQEGLHMEDRDIALAMKLPYLFAYEDGAYLAGPMLQSAKWFDLALVPLGFRLHEESIHRSDVFASLRGKKSVMLGLKVTEESKHAVVFMGIEGDAARFINNKHADSDEPDSLLLNEKALSNRLDDTVILASLEHCAPARVDFAPLLRNSCEILHRWKQEAEAFCNKECSAEERMTALNPLFRALLLDGITMADLTGDAERAGRMRALQQKLLSTLRIPQPLILAQHLPLPDLLSLADELITLIQGQLS